MVSDMAADDGRLAAETLLSSVVSRYQSVHTRKSYQYAVRPYIAWCLQSGYAPLTEDADVPLAYIAMLYKDGRAQRTIAQWIGTLKRYFDSGVQLGYLSVSPLAAVKIPSVEHLQRQEPAVLDRDQVIRLLRAAEGSARTVAAP